MAKACAEGGVGVYENWGPADNDLILGKLKVDDVLPHTDTDKLVRALVERGYTVSKAPSTDLPGALAGAHNWRDAVTSVIDYYTQHDQAFTAMHIAAEIRIHRPDLMFASSWVDHWLRDLFYTNAIRYKDAFACVICYDGAFAGINAYGPSAEVCVLLDLDVVVPPVPQGKTLERSAYDPDQDDLWYRREANVLISDGKEFKAPVRDSKLIITRPLVEAMFASKGAAVMATDKLYVAMVEDEHSPAIVVSMFNQFTDGRTEHSLAEHRGRLLISVEPGTGPDVRVVIDDGSMYCFL